MEPRATRSSGSRIPVSVKSGGERRRLEPKHSLGGTNKENIEVKKEDKRDELLKKEEEPKKFVKAKEIVNEVLQEINRWVCMRLLYSRVLPIISVSFFREINLSCQ